ncbi:MAG: carboxylating nicotinate-nucleotide diphosphorylase [Candidatus Acidiferrales bacterium]
MFLTPTHEPDWDSPALVSLIQKSLEEDIGMGDATSRALVPETCTARARIIAKQRLVCAGLPLVERIFRQLDPAIRFVVRCNEGAAASPGAPLADIAGQARSILSGERIALNFLCHLCGVATLTHRFAEALSGTSAKIRDTRKTTPLLRALEKYAVRVGGGSNHRTGLYDAILIKENHIALAGGVRAAFERAREYARHAPRTGPEDSPLAIQIEVRNQHELREAVSAGADAVLLDNPTPEEATRLVGLARRLRPGCIVEVSGGITLDNVRAFAQTGADFLSAGALTHSAPAADISLLVESILAE